MNDSESEKFKAACAWMRAVEDTILGYDSRMNAVKKQLQFKQQIELSNACIDAIVELAALYEKAAGINAEIWAAARKEIFEK